jgi:hypothetical protein
LFIFIHSLVSAAVALVGFCLRPSSRIESVKRFEVATACLRALFSDSSKEPA